MAILDVLHFPDPRLRKKAVPVSRVDEDIRSLARDMLETMYAQHGVGLAATQVNIQKRLLVMDVSEDRNSPLVLINPEIIARSGERESQEGCLSVPGYYDTVQRSEQVRARFLDEQGEVVERELDGLLSVCLQHEIDHLNGRLFIDYLSPLKRQRLRKKIEKQDKQPAPAL